MKALTWQGNTNVEVLDVPDPVIEEATDVIITVSSTAICGSDLHLYGVFGPFIDGRHPRPRADGRRRRSRTRRETSTSATGSSSRSTSPAVIVDVQRQLYAQCETTQHE